MNFYPNECYICKTKKNLRQCSRCQMISYCGKSHQDMHTEHKEFCKSIADHLKAIKSSHLYAVNGELDADKWWYMKSAARTKFEKKLGRSLTASEIQMFYFPRSCFVCHESQQFLLSNCPNCPSLSFCGAHKDLREHSHECGVVRQSHNFDWQKHSVNFNEIATITRLIVDRVFFDDNKTQNPPKSMAQLLQHYPKPPLEIGELTKICISDIFTFPLTMYSALYKLKMSTKRKIVVFCNGAAGIDEKAWEIILHLMYDVKMLQIVFFGYNDETLTIIDTCENCRRCGKQLQIIDSTTYEDFVKNREEYPDLIVNFCLDSEQDSSILMNRIGNVDWKAIGICQTQQFPIVYAGCTEIESIRQCLERNLLKHTVYYDGANKFRSMRPRRDCRTELSYIINANVIIFQILPISDVYDVAHYSMKLSIVEDVENPESKVKKRHANVKIANGGKFAENAASDSEKVILSRENGIVGSVSPVSSLPTIDKPSKPNGTETNVVAEQETLGNSKTMTDSSSREKSAKKNGETEIVVAVKETLGNGPTKIVEENGDSSKRNETVEFRLSGNKAENSPKEETKQFFKAETTENPAKEKMQNSLTEKAENSPKEKAENSLKEKSENSLKEKAKNSSKEKSENSVKEDKKENSRKENKRKNSPKEKAENSSKNGNSEIKLNANKVEDKRKNGGKSIAGEEDDLSGFLTQTVDPDWDFYEIDCCQVCHESRRCVPCTRCKMISYCNEEHRREHWSEHKDFCKVILGMLKEIGGTTLFDKSKTCHMETWLKTKVNFVVKAQTKLGRQLVDYEKQMILFPRTCFICHESDWSILKTCDCGISLCKQHKNNLKHQKICEDFNAFKAFATIQKKFRQHLSAKLVMDEITEISIKSVPFQKKLKKLPTSINAFIESNLKISNKDLGAITDVRKYFVADYFSRPLTALYALEKLHLTSSKSLNIHIIGATVEEWVFHAYWEIFYHWLPDLKDLTIYFIGPELRENLFTMVSICESCRAMDRKPIPIYRKSVTYHEFLAAKSSLTKPDIIFGFNLDLHEVDYGMTECAWNESICALKQHKNTPFVMTSATERRAQKDHEKFCALLEKSTIHDFSQENPFASTIVERDFETEQLKYPNKFLLVYKQLYEAPKNPVKIVETKNDRQEKSIKNEESASAKLNAKNSAPEKSKVTEPAKIASGKIEETKKNPEKPIIELAETKIGKKSETNAEQAKKADKSENSKESAKLEKQETKKPEKLKKTEKPKEEEKSKEAEKPKTEKSKEPEKLKEAGKPKEEEKPKTEKLKEAGKPKEAEKPKAENSKEAEKPKEAEKLKEAGKLKEAENPIEAEKPKEKKIKNVEIVKNVEPEVVKETAKKPVAKNAKAKKTVVAEEIKDSTNLPSKSNKNDVTDSNLRQEVMTIKKNMTQVVKEMNLVRESFKKISAENAKQIERNERLQEENKLLMDVRREIEETLKKLVEKKNCQCCDKCQK